MSLASLLAIAAWVAWTGTSVAASMWKRETVIARDPKASPTTPMIIMAAARSTSEAPVTVTN
jgi:hypothetical protein